MSTLVFANNATTTLASPITNLATSVSVVPGTGSRFPVLSAGQIFIATLTDAATGLVNEIVQVTATTGDTFTIVRAQEGTTAVSWLAGDFFQHFWTAGQAGVMAQAAQFTTGDIKATLKATADATWVMWTDGSIGNATSNATVRANADTFNLYSLIWTNTANADCPVQNSAGVPTGARGASALADFNASNRLMLPKVQSRAVGAAGQGSGLSNRNLGTAVGAETATLTQGNLPNVNLPVTDPHHLHNQAPGTLLSSGGPSPSGVGGALYAFGGQTDSQPTGVTVATGGSGAPVPTVEPTTYVNWMIKL